jgi:hypothetical protein
MRRKPMDKVKTQSVGLRATSAPNDKKQPAASMLAPQRAVLYRRLSTKEQVEGQGSIPSQRDLCTRFFAVSGYAIVNVFTDAGSAMAHRQFDSQRKIE